MLVDPDRLPSFAGDESGHEPTLPRAVVRADERDAVVEALGVASEFSVPVTARGAGTGKAGGCIPSPGGLVLDLTGMDRIHDIDTASLTAEVGPGVITGDFRTVVEAEGLFYPPDPNSLDTCTLGGNVATNAGGPSSMKYGVTRDYVLGVEMVLSGGRTMDLGRRTHKGVVGYDLSALVVGSEGTLGVVTRIVTRLRPLPRGIRTLLAYFPTVSGATNCVAALSRAGVDLRVAEFIDTFTLDAARSGSALQVPSGAGAALLLEIDGERDDEGMDGALEAVGSHLVDHGADPIHVAASDRERRTIWDVRRQLSVSVKEGRSHWISEDVGVPRGRVPDLVAAVGRIRDTSGLDIATYGHAGEGNLHVNILWDSPDDEARARDASEEVFRAALALDGTISGEHGVGLTKAGFLSWEQPPEVIDAQRAIRRVFDPQGIMNPGKIFS